ANRSRLPLRAELEFDFSRAQDGGDDVLSRLASRLATEEPTANNWSYTNAGWCLLGRAIETVTGVAWEDAMRANLFAPAGMNRTTFATELVSGSRASGHDMT